MPRSTPITPDVAVHYLLEYTGENAASLKDVEWPDKHYVASSPERKASNGVVLPETMRLYAQAAPGAMETGIDFHTPPYVWFDLARMQFYRTNNARIACYRPTDENPKVTGFGRPHPVSGKMCHQDFSETYVDRKPGTAYTNHKGEQAVWKSFDPVYLKIRPASGDSYILKVATTWNAGVVTVSVERNPADVPEAFASWEFPERASRQAQRGEVDITRHMRPRPHGARR